MTDEQIQRAFRSINDAVTKSILSNPDTARIRATGKFERFIRSNQSAEYSKKRFRKYTVGYTPFIDVGSGKITRKQDGKTYQRIYEWLGLKKYGISYSTDAQRKTIAFFIYRKMVSFGSFKRRNPDKRTEIALKAVKAGKEEAQKAVTAETLQYISSIVQQEIDRINAL